MRTRESLFQNPQLPQTRAMRLRKQSTGVVIPRKGVKKGPAPKVNVQPLGPGVAFITGLGPRPKK